MSYNIFNIQRTGANSKCVNSSIAIHLLSRLIQIRITQKSQVDTIEKELLLRAKQGPRENGKPNAATTMNSALNTPNGDNKNKRKQQSKTTHTNKVPQVSRANSNKQHTVVTGTNESEEEYDDATQH